MGVLRPVINEIKCKIPIESLNLAHGKSQNTTSLGMLQTHWSSHVHFSNLVFIMNSFKIPGVFLDSDSMLLRSDAFYSHTCVL